MLIYAVIFINLALLFYTVGVWSEKLQKVLKPWHLAMFWTGFLFDTAGTTAMASLAKEGFTFNFHGITGVLAILLMLLHSIWATAVLIGKREERKKKFHKFSLFVWCVWLIPFISGAAFAMMK